MKAAKTEVALDGAGEQGSLQQATAQWAERALPADANHLAKLKDEVLKLDQAPDSARKMANICLALMLHAEQHGVDLLTVAREKLAENQTRTYGPVDEQGITRHIELP